MSIDNTNNTEAVRAAQRGALEGPAVTVAPVHPDGDANRLTLHWRGVPLTYEAGAGLVEFAGVPVPPSARTEQLQWLDPLGCTRERLEVALTLTAPGEYWEDAFAVADYVAQLGTQSPLDLSAPQGTPAGAVDWALGLRVQFEDYWGRRSYSHSGGTTVCRACAPQFFSTTTLWEDAPPVGLEVFFDWTPGDHGWEEVVECDECGCALANAFDDNDWPDPHKVLEAAGAVAPALDQCAGCAADAAAAAEDVRWGGWGFSSPQWDSACWAAIQSFTEQCDEGVTAVDFVAAALRGEGEWLTFSYGANVEFRCSTCHDSLWSASDLSGWVSRPPFEYAATRWGTLRAQLLDFFAERPHLEVSLELDDWGDEAELIGELEADAAEPELSFAADVLCRAVFSAFVRVRDTRTGDEETLHGMAAEYLEDDLVDAVRTTPLRDNGAGLAVCALEEARELALELEDRFAAVATDKASALTAEAERLFALAAGGQS